MNNNKDITELQEGWLVLREKYPKKSLKEITDLSGYAKGTNPSQIAKSLRGEIKDRINAYIALHGMEAADALIDVMRDPIDLGAALKLKAADTILNRIVPTAKEVIEVSTKMPNTVIVIPTLNSEDSIKIVNKLSNPDDNNL